MKFEEFLLQESINDKGILKAVFIVGLPGAGKSYTVSNLKGQVSPKIVNTDVALEFLSKKTKIPANSETWKTVFRDSTKKMTATMLYNYINGMLPLFIDGTSNDASNVLSRAGILESLGYDVGMIFIDTDIEVAKQRAIERAETIGRTVDPTFIDKVYKESEANKKYFQSKFSFFKVYENNGQGLDNDLMQKLFKQVQGFYTEDVQNPVGTRNLEKISEEKEKYLVPTLFQDETLKNKLSTWYKT